MSQPIDPRSPLIGTWELLAVQFESADNGERQDLFGPTPRGRLVLTDAGDFMTVITSGDRPPTRDVGRLFETMMAYAGEFHLDGDKITIS